MVDGGGNIFCDILYGDQIVQQPWGNTKADPGAEKATIFVMAIDP